MEGAAAVAEKTFASNLTMPHYAYPYPCLQSEGGDLEAAAAAAGGNAGEATPEGKGGTISKSLDPQMLEKVGVPCVVDAAGGVRAPASFREG